MTEDPKTNPVPENPPKQDREAQDPPKDPPKQDLSKEDRTVPYHRFKEVNDARKDLENRLNALEEEREQAAEDRQQKQGEYQELANKRQKKIEKLEGELKQVKADWTRERRLNVWNSVAQGVIRQEAISDAFSFLSEDELSGIDEADENAFRQLAQNLAEVKPYLAVEGPRGAGSGGSREPVLSSGKALAGGREPLFAGKRRNRKQWK